MLNKNKPLSHIAFSILLALGPEPRHGYEIMKLVKKDTSGRVSIGPGSLYGTIKQLVADRLIEEVKDTTDDERRRYYQLTYVGKEAVRIELQQYKETLRIAAKRKLFARPSEEPA